MRLSCSASAFFSSSLTSSIASFATYSTSFSLIFIGESDLLDPRCRPGFVQLCQQYGSHLHELFAPYLIRHVDYDSRALDCSNGRGSCQLVSDERRPKFLEHFQVKLLIPIG